MVLKYSKQILYFLCIFSWLRDELLHSDFVEHMHHKYEAPMIHSFIFDFLNIESKRRFKFHEIVQDHKEGSLFSDFLYVFEVSLKHIESSIIELHFVL